MGYAVDRSLGQNDDLLSIAVLHARDIDALCTDVAAIIFPTAMQSPTDAVISAVSMKLLQLVSDIESRVLDKAIEPNARPTTWPLLAQSGFLREADLVDFALARVSEDRLDAKLGASQGMLPVELLDHADGNVADAAQLLLAADSLHRRSRGRSFLTLPPELLHKLCWRIVAALEVSHGRRSSGNIEAARDIIAGYDEAQTSVSAARKIVHFIGDEYAGELLDPSRSGLHLFVATLSAQIGLDHDHILRLADCGSAAPLAVVLVAAGLSKEHARANLVLLRGETLTSREAAIFDTSYDLIDRQTAVTTIASWSVARSSYLALGKP
jgi:hypothetical protein